MILTTDNKEALAYFKEKDSILYQKMIEIGIVEREGTSEPFTALVESILSQQISTKAALTVKSRLLDLVGNITYQSILSLDREDLKSIGISYRKCDYLIALAQAVESKQIDFSTFNNLSNQDIINQLIQLPGIGVWTAEMFLLFCMKRQDVISYGDLMIREGMKKLYGYEHLDKKVFNQHASIYNGYASIVSLYLWVISKEI